MEKYEIEDNAITGFRKEYAFLSNMYSYKVSFTYKGYIFNSVETAYHASKNDMYESFSKITNPVFARSRGNSIKLKEGFDLIKDEIMEELVYLKFTSSNRLRNKSSYVL